MSSYNAHFKAWLDENPFVLSYEEEVGILLFSGLAIEGSTIYQPTVYTADFKIHFDDKAEGILYEEYRSNKKSLLYAHDGVCYIEVKPEYDYKNNVQQSMIRMKWLFHSQGILTNKVVPIGGPRCFFANTYTPKSFMLTKTGKQRKAKYPMRTVDEWIRMNAPVPAGQ